MCSQEFSTARQAETATEGAHGHTHDDPVFKADCSACLAMHAGVFTAQTNAEGCVRVIADRDATITAQSEEIARLRAEAEANEAGCTQNFNLSQQRRVEVGLLKGDVEELTLQRNAAIEARDAALEVVSAAVRERDSHAETIVQLTADLKRATDELDELRTNNAALGLMSVESLGKVAAAERELDAKSQALTRLADTEAARDRAIEERTTIGVKAAELTAKNHTLREDGERMKSVVWTLNNALTAYHDFTSELLEAQRLASQIPGLYATDDEPEPPAFVVDVKFDGKAATDRMREELAKDPGVTVTFPPRSSDQVPSL